MTALIIAAITAALQNHLQNRLAPFASEASLSDAKVTVLPPDRIALGSEEPNQINLFLYRVSPNASLSRGRTKAGTTPALSLDLFYLLTLYGTEALNIEKLLGLAISALGEISSATLKESLSVAAKDPKSSRQESRIALPADLIARQDLKITPQFLSIEDMSKLWSSLQAKYRPSLAYQISGVIME